MKVKAVKLENLMVRRGGSVDPKKFPDEEFDLYSIPAYDRGQKDIVLGREIGSSKQILATGDVLLSKIVPHIRRAWVVGEFENRRMIGSGEWIVFRSADCDPKFLTRVLTNDSFHARFMSTVSGVGGSLLRARPAEVAKIEIPLPPLAEQKRIAGILDAADALRAKRRAALAQLDALAQSLFLDLFGRCGRPPISIGAPSFGDSTGFVNLCDIARLATGHTPDRDEPSYWGGSIPWISLTDIRTLDGTVATETLQNVTEEGIRNSSSVKLPPGTVCFSRTASVGFVTVMGSEMATSQDFVNWVCGDRIDPVYLMWALRLSRPYLLSKSAGSTHKTIYVRHAEQFQVYLPPLPLQQSFAAAVEAIEKQKARHREHLAGLDALFASLQHRAFRGEL
jgi:type I restriction enzyme S subunit